MPRDGRISFSDLIGQALAQIRQLFPWELTNGNARMCQSTAGFTFRGRMKASWITTEKPWRQQSNCYRNKRRLMRISRQPAG
jgi:hypothetical protein